MNAAETVYVTLLGGWCVVTVVYHFPSKLGQSISRWDVFGLIPIWRFFAPQPNRHDWVLLIRTESAPGVFARWIEWKPAAPSRAPRCLFNPVRRLRKAMLDLIAAFQADSLV